MSARKLSEPEMTSAHSVKILLCYLLDRLDRPVPSEQLHEIALDSGVINHFYYSEAMADLIASGAVTVIDENGEETVRIEEKGRLGSEYFNRYIPATFRRSILTAAYSYFADIRRENEISCAITDSDNGCIVKFSIKDTEFPLMEMSLYAPDREQAELIAERLKRNPSAFYSGVIGLALNNPEEKLPEIEL